MTSELCMQKTEDSNEYNTIQQNSNSIGIESEIPEKEELNNTRNSFEDKDKIEQKHFLIHHNDFGLDNSATGYHKDTCVSSDTITYDKVSIANDSDQAPLPEITINPSEIQRFLIEILDSNTSSDEYALCGLWDFAGQKEFYATHQVFLTNCAVYLLVADLSDFEKPHTNQYFSDFTSVGEYIDFWFDSIHCLRNEDKLDDTDEDHHIDPPVIVVCTGTDKYTTLELDLKQNNFLNELKNALRKQSKFNHYRTTFFVSNKDDTDDVFQKIRDEISKAAMQMSSWGEEKPLKWILLEHCIERIKSEGFNIVYYKELYWLAREGHFGITETSEFDVFLKFQHGIGNIIFVKEFGEYVIINPQWLANAFRCLVSDRLNPEIINHPDYAKLEDAGVLTTKLITALFNSKPGFMFNEYKEHILKVMEKFDIIIKPREANLSKKDGPYFLPCMLPQSTLEGMRQKFEVCDDKCTSSSWFCIEFTFLPPAFFNHILAWYTRKYQISSVEGVQNCTLFRGIGIFEIDTSELQKLVVTVSKNTIAIQIWRWLNDEETTTDFVKIREEFCNKIENIQQKYRLRLQHTKKIACTDSDFCTSSVELEKLQKCKSYNCRKHHVHSTEYVLLPWFCDQR